MAHRDQFPANIMPASVFCPRQALSLPPTLENGLNMWRELNKLLPSIGTWHLIRHFSPEQKCSCRRERTNDDSNPNCALCGGRGFPYRETPALMVAANQLAAGASPEMVGSVFTVSEESLVLFAAPQTRVTTSDMIFQVTLTSDQRIAYPIERLGRYDVGRVLPMRSDRGGEIDMLMILANEEEGLKR